MEKKLTQQYEHTRLWGPELLGAAACTGAAGRRGNCCCAGCFGAAGFGEGTATGLGAGAAGLGAAGLGAAGLGAGGLGAGAAGLGAGGLGAGTTVGFLGSGFLGLNRLTIVTGLLS